MERRIVGQRTEGADPRHRRAAGVSPATRYGRGSTGAFRSDADAAPSRATRAARDAPPWREVRFARERFRIGRLRHLESMLVSRLVALERRFEREDRAAVLDRDHAARGEAGAVARAVDLVKDRHLGIAGAQKIGVQGMAQAALRPCARRPPGPAPAPDRQKHAVRGPWDCCREKCFPRSSQGRAGRAPPESGWSSAKAIPPPAERASRGPTDSLCSAQ